MGVALDHGVLKQMLLMQGEKESSILQVLGIPR